MNAQNKSLIPDEENLMQQLVAKYFPYWPVFLAALLLGVAVAFLYLKFSTPIYEATATLIIKDERKGNEESKLMESLNQISSKKIVENEIEVIQSRKLMHDVAKKLDLFTPISQKKSFKYRSAWFTSPVQVKALQPDSLKTKLNIPISFDNNSKEVTLDKRYKYPLNTAANTPYGKLEFVVNENFQPAESNKEFFLSVYRPQEMIPGLLSSLKAEASGKLSSIVNLSYRDEIPDRAVEVLNELIYSYRQSEIDEKNALAKNTMEFVNERLGLVTMSLDSIQQKVQAYKSGRNAVDISTQGQLYLQNVSDNNQKLSEVNTQISVLNQVENSVKNSNYSGGIVPSTLGVSDPMLTQLLGKLNTLELAYEKGKSTIGENNPRLLEIKDQINKIKPDILKNINSQQKSLYAMRNNISSTNSSYNAMLRTVPQKERQLIDISRAEQNKRNIYDFLLQKKAESELAYASTIANNKVVDYAAAGNNPVSPKRMVVYLGAIVFFLAVPVGFLTIRESLTGKVMFRQEIEKRTDIPVIGEVAYNKSKEPIVIASGRRSFIAEEFRKLRLSLSFLGINATHKKILVTSSIPGEGKSFIAANLAVSLSLTGKKVIVVDMDLNNPTLERIFNSEETSGVTEFLEGKKSAEEIIKPVSGYENIHLITAGTLPEEPTELLSNGKAEELIEYLDNIFDIVLIDTSPLVPVTDGYMLTHICDTTLYVVRHQYTPKVLIKRMDANSKINPIHNPGIVFNGVKQRGFAGNYYRYSYGYDYAHGKYQGQKRGTVKS